MAEPSPAAGDGGRAPRLLAVNHTGLVSGAERVLLRALQAAHGRGWETAVAVPDGPLASLAADVGSRWVPIPDLMLPGGPRPVGATVLAAKNLAAARRVRRAAAGADLVVATGLRVLPTLALARPRAPVAWLAQALIDRRRWRMLVRACGGVVDRAVAVSQAVADSIGSVPFPVPVVWNGTPWPVDPGPVDRPGPPVVGCAAILTRWKGQHVLLEALALLDGQVVVELMGASFPKDTAYVDRLRRRADQPDLAGRVRFLGHVDDPLAAMRRWSVAVVGSVDPEAGPLAALEAMSVGVPLVATAHGGPTEIVGDAGRLVPPGDPRAMAGAIRSLLEDPDARRRCAAAGPRIVGERLRLDAQIDALVDELEATASVSGARGRAPC